MVDPKTVDKDFNAPTVDLAVISTRLKILEERYNTLRKKANTTENSIIEDSKSNFIEFKLINEDVVKLKLKIKEITEKLELLTDEVENFADSRDFMVLKKYIDYWQPTDFVTRKELNKFLRKKFEE